MSVGQINIAAIVPVYNPQADDYARICSYAQQVDFCIVQDDSPENNEKTCLAFFSQTDISVTYRWNGRNLGLVGSLNRAFEESIALRADWILVMNPDGELDSGAIPAFARYIVENDTSNIAALMPVYDTERRPRRFSQGAKEIVYGDMSGTLFNVSVLKEVGCYDPKTYFYGCDVEWCLRARKKGYRLIEVSNALIHHHPASTRKFTVFGKTLFAYGVDSPVRYYYQFRSGFYIHDLYHDARQDAFMLCKLLKVLLLFEDKTEYLRRYREAKRDFKAGYFGNYSSRFQDGA